MTNELIKGRQNHRRQPTILAAMAAVLLLFGGASAQADTYAYIDCYCADQLTQKLDTCTWKSEYTLSPWETHEFRFRCMGDATAGDTLGSGGNVSSHGSSTTCTINITATVVGASGYRTQSCTNWSITTKDTVHFT